MEQLLEINNIFNIIDNSKINNVSLRQRNISIRNAVNYRFLYSKKDTTKQQITSILNYNTDSNGACRTSYDRKENNISIELYEKLFYKIKRLYNKLCNVHVNKNNTTTFPVIAVDGTNNNIDTNNAKQLQTSLNMGFYNISEDIPVNLIPCGVGNRNKEIQQLKQYIEDNSIKHVIFVADRAYSSCKLFKYLHDSHNKFIIRVKSNLKHLNNQQDKEYSSYLNKRVRIIRHKEQYDKTVKNKGKKYTLKITVKYDIITNLMNRKEYPDSKILDLYRSRWDVEVFFKFIKSNCKLSKLNEKRPEQRHKLMYCELILCYILKLVSKIYLKTKDHSNSKKKKNGKTVKCKIRINNTNIINGIYGCLLNDIINSTLTVDKLNKFCKSYIIIVKNDPDRSFPRISKLPFSKWYVKKYHENHKYLKIVKKITDESIDDLNKNLKLLYNTITLVKIETIDEK
jgi:hypothetical protein